MRILEATLNRAGRDSPGLCARCAPRNRGRLPSPPSGTLPSNLVGRGSCRAVIKSATDVQVTARQEPRPTRFKGAMSQGVGRTLSSTPSGGENAPDKCAPCAPEPPPPPPLRHPSPPPPP